MCSLRDCVPQYQKTTQTNWSSWSSCIFCDAFLLFFVRSVPGPIPGPFRRLLWNAPLRFAGWNAAIGSRTGPCAAEGRSNPFKSHESSINITFKWVENGLPSRFNFLQLLKPWHIYRWLICLIRWWFSIATCHSSLPEGSFLQRSHVLLRFMFNVFQHVPFYDDDPIWQPTMAQNNNPKPPNQFGCAAVGEIPSSRLNGYRKRTVTVLASSHVSW